MQILGWGATVNKWAGRSRPLGAVAACSARHHCFTAADAAPAGATSEELRQQVSFPPRSLLPHTHAHAHAQPVLGPLVQSSMMNWAVMHIGRIRNATNASWLVRECHLLFDAGLEIGSRQSRLETLMLRLDWAFLLHLNFKHLFVATPDESTAL